MICFLIKLKCIQISESWLWRTEYRWLMIMDENLDDNISNFLSIKNIKLTLDSEVQLAYPKDENGIINKWHIFDVYRTAFEPRGQLKIEILTNTLGKWGNRLWKFDKRYNLENLTLNVVTIVSID